MSSKEKKGYEDYNNDVKILTLYNPETNREYTFCLNTVDYNRALNDDIYAASLLESNEDNEPQEEEKQNEDEHLDNGKDTGQHNWKFDETKALIAAMGNYMDDFNHLKKRKFLFNNVSNDLLSRKFIATSSQCCIQWKSLVRTYKNCKDQKKKSGRGPTRFLFFDEMEDLLGDKPSTSCSHTLESSLEVSETSEGSAEYSVEDISVSSMKKRKKSVNEQYLILKQDEYYKRQVRHNERIGIEKKKIQLLENILENNVKQN